jgi:Na+/H+-dicarboxylate symporter
MSSIQKQKTAGVLGNYFQSILLIAAIAAGAALGVFLRKDAAILKPFGDIFLNLLFTAVVPLVFFSIASAIAEMADLRRLGKILALMILIFALTGIVSSCLMLAGVKMFPPTVTIDPSARPTMELGQVKSGADIVRAFTVPDFADLLSKKNMLALIFFSLLTGLAASTAGDRGKLFVEFLSSGNQVMMKLIGLVMLYAPVGLCAYFAYLVGVFGPELLGSYLRVVALYYPVALIYFIAGYSFYAWLAGGLTGIRLFWSRIIPPSLTALGTGSSLATIPSNIRAADEIGVPRDISQIIIPVGATIHMDGTCISAIVKISLLFSLFGMSFSGLGTMLTAVGIALLSGMVMAGIPGGGFTGELLIITLYGFPPEALPIISMVGTLVDPPATMVNAIGSNTTSMLVARILGGRKWLKC